MNFTIEFLFMSSVLLFINFQVNWRTVAWGITLQLLFAILILRWDIGYNVFKWIGDRVATFLGFTAYGDAYLIF